MCKDKNWSTKHGVVDQFSEVFMESYKLSNGMVIPAVGFGCYNAEGGDNLQMLKDAIDFGYTLFDTASIYGTESDLGNAIKEKNVDRKSLFIQSKLWFDEMGYDDAKRALERSLKRLQMDYIDIYLIHWPKARKGVSDDEWKSLQKETYKAMEEMMEEGTIKAIGLSNFLPHHLDNILSFCNVAPVVDQIEYHIGYTQEKARSYAAEKGLVVQAWSPLGRGSIFKNDDIIELAEKYGVTTSQLALRFNYQSGIISLPKAAKPERQKLNLDIFGFEISQEDMDFIACLPNTLWGGEHPDISIPTASSKF